MEHPITATYINEAWKRNQDYISNAVSPGLSYKTIKLMYEYAKVIEQEPFFVWGPALIPKIAALPHWSPSPPRPQEPRKPIMPEQLT